MAACTTPSPEESVYTAQDLPFKTNPLTGEICDPTKESLVSAQLDLLPASYESTKDFLVTPRLDLDYLSNELNIDRLQHPLVRKWFWTVGRRALPRPLHRQRLLQRTIIVVEQMDLHLVWGSGALFLKPVPRFLLDPHVWKQSITCMRGCSCWKERQENSEDGLCSQNRIRCQALGFLLSYVSLVRHESDFFLARQEHLLPLEMQWSQWQQFCKELLDHKDRHAPITDRWSYGELRLSRLNKIYWFVDGRLPRAYLPQWNQYDQFWLDNIAWIAPATVYVVVALTAMQVGLATDALQGNAAFQAVSYGLTVFSLIALPGAFCLVASYFAIVFVQNAIWAREQHKASGKHRETGQNQSV